MVRLFDEKTLVFKQLDNKKKLNRDEIEARLLQMLQGFHW